MAINAKSPVAEIVEALDIAQTEANAWETARACAGLVKYHVDHLLNARDTKANKALSLAAIAAFDDADANYKECLSAVTALYVTLQEARTAEADRKAAEEYEAAEIARERAAEARWSQTAW
jgi:hypothetical protein